MARSTLFVDGYFRPFGDFVRLQDGRAYPLCLEGLGREVTPPESRFALSPEETATLSSETLSALVELAPGLEVLRGALTTEARAEGGYIYAFAQTDIADPASELHGRETCGIEHLTDAYMSLDPGKFTLAPYYAVQAAEAIEAAVPK